MSSGNIVRVLCNSPDGRIDPFDNVLSLDYRNKSLKPNVRIGLPGFIQGLFHLDDRILDLLELSAYIYAADRYASRGPRDAVEYHSWSRHFDFHVRVRDHDFWNSRITMSLLTQALLFLTGDASINFTFYPGHATPPESLFDRPGYSPIPTQPPSTVVLFSGGIDSLAGAMMLLETSTSPIVLVSHQSQPGVKRTQKALAGSLNAHYQNRVSHYPFECNLTGGRGIEESQRSRFFLFASIAVAVATASHVDNIQVFENGVTGMNLSRRQDLINARASRTTHPQTIHHLRGLYSEILGRPFEIKTPYLDRTKAEVLGQLVHSQHPELISSSVSCSKAISHPGTTTHCGCCYQCVDRRVASFSSRAQRFDHNGLYFTDFINGPIPAEARTTVVDYVRQAVNFDGCDIDWFYESYLPQLAEITPYLPIDGDEMDKVEFVWNLHRRHADAVLRGVDEMRRKYDDLKTPIQRESLLAVIANREYLRPEAQRLVSTLVGILGASVPEMFRINKPKDEPDLNAKISALLKTHEPKLRSEHPTVSFACAKVVPDHELQSGDVLIESEYIRKGTTPSKATDGIASDLTKYPEGKHILFIVYDPNHAIISDTDFKRDIEAKGRCTVITPR